MSAASSVSLGSVTLITCVVPVHNGELYLAEAIESILGQSHAEIEVIVVDDGSTDGSADLARSFGDPVRVVAQERRGPDGARNRGILEARGELIAFLDADDLFRPGKLSRQLHALEGSPACEICLCVAENFWQPGLELEQKRYAALGKLRATHTFIAMLARRRAFETVGLLDDTAGSDGSPSSGQVAWFLRAADCGVSPLVLDDVLVDRRMHRDSTTHTSRSLDSYFALLSERIERQRAS